MSIIDGGKITEAAWIKLATLLLAIIAALFTVTIAMGSHFASRAIDKLDEVGDAVIQHETEIANIKEAIKVLQGNRNFYIQPRPNDGFQFRGRAGERKPRGDVPRPPSKPDKVAPQEPQPAPRPDPAPQPQRPNGGRIWEAKE